jgi:transglutaminase-like putative cysteine protease
VTELKIEVDLVADMTVYNPFDFFVEEEAETGRSPIPRTSRRPVDLPQAGAGRAAAVEPS